MRYWDRDVLLDATNKLDKPLLDNSFEHKHTGNNGIVLEVEVFDKEDNKNIKEKKLQPLRNSIKKYLATCSSNNCKCKNPSTRVKIIICVGTVTTVACLICWLHQGGHLDPSISSVGSLLKSSKNSIGEALMPYTDFSIVNFDCGNCCQHCGGLECKEVDFANQCFSVCSIQNRCEVKCPGCIIL